MWSYYSNSCLYSSIAHVLKLYAMLCLRSVKFTVDFFPSHTDKFQSWLNTSSWLEVYPEFFSLGTDILSQIILGCGGLFWTLQDTSQHPWLLPTRCQLYSLRSYNNQKYLRTLPNVTWGAKLPLVKNHWFNSVLLYGRI